MSGLNRALRRKLEKKRKIEENERFMQQLQISAKRVEQNLKREQENSQSRAMAMAMYYLFGIHMHRLYGFGAKRLMRVFDAIDEETGGWWDGAVTVDDLRERMKQETGIDIVLK